MSKEFKRYIEGKRWAQIRASRAPVSRLANYVLAVEEDRVEEYHEARGRGKHVAETA